MAKKTSTSHEHDHDPRRQAYLSFNGKIDQTITGVGLFSKGIPPEPVSDSIARQFETDEMKALGWIVEWRDESQQSEGKE